VICILKIVSNPEVLLQKSFIIVSKVYQVPCQAILSTFKEILYEAEF